MNALSIMKETLRHTDTLYYLLQQKQEEHEKYAQNSTQNSGKLWNYSSVAELRENLTDIERHMSVHSKTSGKSLEEVLSEDEAYVIMQSLMSVKVYLYSIIMSIQILKSNNKMPATVSDQIAEIIRIVDTVKSRLAKCGVCSNLVEQGITFARCFPTLIVFFMTTETDMPTNPSKRK